jgi:uncharacterized protein (TIGR03435 family)
MKTVLRYREAFGFAVIFCVAAGLRGQDANPTGFEVASIRLNSDNGPQRLDLFPQFRAQNVTLKDLFLLAYDVKAFQVSGGPSWFGSDRYDISAKMAGVPSPGRDAMILQRRRLQMLLHQRFALAVRHETKELPVYVLTVAKGGPKLKGSACTEGDPKNPAPAPGKTIMDYCGSSGFSRGRFEASSATIADVAKALSNLLGRAVVDKTGIDGTFHVVLTFAIDDTTRRFPDAPTGADNPAAADDGVPNIFTAIQEQLGLKLESGRGPVDVMVIDHVEKPSEN